jgi:uncharacterized protein (TIGR04552 family)
MSGRLPQSGGFDAFLPFGPHPPSRLDIGLQELSLQQAHEIRLLLRGDSVIDWHRLGLHSDDDVRRLLAVNSIDINNPSDLARLDALRSQAVGYIIQTLGLKLHDQVATEVSPIQLFQLASDNHRLQRQACTLLKVMNIIYHLDARELRTALPIPDSELYSMVEQSVVRLFDELRSAGVPVAEFSWSRKTRESLITKLLVKRETSAARVFDRLRFRLVVEHERDLLPTMQLMLKRFIPFNYVVPSQTVNTLVSDTELEERIRADQDFAVVTDTSSQRMGNEFSGEGYKVLNFVADLPIRVDQLLVGTKLEGQGNVVFLLAEFQIVDRQRAVANETGENAHEHYKNRQHLRVRERLLREPKRAPR